MQSTINTLQNTISFAKLHSEKKKRINYHSFNKKLDQKKKNMIDSSKKDRDYELENSHEFKCYDYKIDYSCGYPKLIKNKKKKNKNADKEEKDSMNNLENQKKKKNLLKTILNKAAPIESTLANDDISTKSSQKELNSFLEERVKIHPKININSDRHSLIIGSNRSLNSLNDEDIFMNQDEIINQIFSVERKFSNTNNSISNDKQINEIHQLNNKFLTFIAKNNNTQFKNNNFCNYKQQISDKDFERKEPLNTIAQKIFIHKSSESQNFKNEETLKENEKHKQIVKINHSEKSLNNFLRDTVYSSKKIGFSGEEENNYYINSKNFDDKNFNYIRSSKKMHSNFSITEEILLTKDTHRKEKVNENKIDFNFIYMNEPNDPYFNINKHEKTFIMKKKGLNKNRSTKSQINILNINNSNNISNKKKLYPITNHSILVNKLNNKFETKYNELLNSDSKRGLNNSIIIDKECINNLPNLNSNFSPTNSLNQILLLKEFELLKSIKIENQDKYKPTRRKNSHFEENTNNDSNFTGTVNMLSHSSNHDLGNSNNSPSIKNLMNENYYNQYSKENSNFKEKNHSKYIYKKLTKVNSFDDNNNQFKFINMNVTKNNNNFFPEYINKFNSFIFGNSHKNE